MERRGRPKKVVAKDHQYRIRLDDFENRMLETLSVGNDITKAEVIRKALKMFYNLYVNTH